MSVFLLVIACCLWFVAMGALCFAAMEALMDGRHLRSCIFGTCGIVVLAASVAIVSGFTDGTESTTLCLRGHQAWSRTEHPTVFVGKVPIPAHTSTSKVWVCDEWEAER